MLINTNKTKKIDDLGRVTIPMPIRKSLKATTRVWCEVYQSDGMVVLDFDSNASVGDKKRLDSVGRVTIPISIRDELNLIIGSTVKIYQQCKKLYLQPVDKIDCFGNEINDNYIEYRGKKISSKSFNEIVKLIRKEKGNE